MDYALLIEILAMTTRDQSDLWDLIESEERIFFHNGDLYLESEPGEGFKYSEYDDAEWIDQSDSRWIRFAIDYVKTGKMR